MRELVITTDGEKGRSFRAALLAYVVSKPLLEGDTVRPLWAMLATSEAESLPFIRNLQSGRKAGILGTSSKSNETFECLKSAGYEWHPQRHPEGTVWTVFLPELYRIDPGMVDPAGVRFAMLPDAKWLEAADERIAREVAALYPERDGWNKQQTAEENERRLTVCRYLTMVAPLFCAYLDRRTRAPLIPDRRFYAMVLAACLSNGLATLANEDSWRRQSKWGRDGFGYEEHDVAAVGLSPGVACRCEHERLEKVLAECVRVYEGGAVREERKAA